VPDEVTLILVDDGVAARSRGEYRSRSAHTLQHRCGIIDSSIDVEVRSQILGKLLFVASTPTRDRTESHPPSKLHTQVPKAANALYSDQISTAQAGIAKSVVGCDSRAE